jgi:hypothetical protein
MITTTITIKSTTMKNIILLAAALAAGSASLAAQAQTGGGENTTPAVASGTALAENRGAAGNAGDVAGSRGVQRKSYLTIGWNNSTLVNLAPFVFALAITATVMGIRASFRLAGQRSTNEILQALIEKGQPIKPELIESLKGLQEGRPVRDSRAGAFAGAGCLKWGLVMLAAGAGLLIMREEAGWIVLLIGAALALYAAIAAWSRPKSDTARGGADSDNSGNSGNTNSGLQA